MPSCDMKRIVRNDLFLLQACLRDQVVELNAQEDLSLVVEIGGELLGDRIEILMLMQRLAKELSQLGINRVWIVVAKKPRLESISSSRSSPSTRAKAAKTLMRVGSRFGLSATVRGLRISRRTILRPVALALAAKQKEPFEPTLSAAGRLLSDYCHRYRLSLARPSFQRRVASRRDLRIISSLPL